MNGNQDHKPGSSPSDNAQSASTSDATLPEASPEIAQFYADPHSKPRAFAKALRRAQTKSFHPDDVEKTLGHLKETDPTLSRTLTFAASGVPPDAVEQWINRATLLHLQALVPDAISNLAPSADDTLNAILRALRADFISKDKLTRQRAENLLRLSLIWLVARRDLDPIDAFRALAENRAGGEDKPPRSIRRSAQRLLTRAKPTQRRDMVLVAELHREVVTAALRDRQEAIRAQAQLRERIDELDRQFAIQQAQSERLERRAGEILGQLASANDALRNEQELRARDAEEAKGRLRRLLSERIDPLLSDARDALDFEPPRLDAAKQSIDLARAKIGVEVKNADG